MADIVPGFSPREVAAVLAGCGVPPSGGRTADGAAYLSAVACDLHFQVLFFDSPAPADPDARAGVLQFSSAFTVDVADAARRVAEWNARTVVGKAYVGLDGDVELEFATCVWGAGTDTVARATELFVAAMVEFHTHFYAVPVVG